ncbi:transposase family protein [Heyndrickxia sporothermodurans]
MEEVEEKLCIHVERSVEPHPCPVCHSVTQKIHDYRIQKIKHLKMFERQPLLFYRRRPYVCPCGKMKLLLNEAIVPREKIQKLIISSNCRKMKRSSL